MLFLREEEVKSSQFHSNRDVSLTRGNDRNGKNPLKLGKLPYEKATLPRFGDCSSHQSPEDILVVHLAKVCTAGGL